MAATADARSSGFVSTYLDTVTMKSPIPPKPLGKCGASVSRRRLSRGMEPRRRLSLTSDLDSMRGLTDMKHPREANCLA